MPPRKTTGAGRSAATAAPREGMEAFLVPLGVFAALALPHLVHTTLSSDLLRDSKLLVLSVGAAVALAGLALGSLRSPAASPFLSGGWSRPLLLFVAGALALAFVSGVLNSTRVDPLTAAAVLAPIALGVVGASPPGEACARRALGLLAAAGAFTGLLAGLQRFPGVLRFLPIEAEEPRFLAAALIGNPGDVAAALVFPALILWMRVAAPGPFAARLVPGAGLALVLLGLGATESVGPLAAFAAAWALHTVLDLRRRWKAFAGILVVAALSLGLTGAGRRAVVKAVQLARGETARATTQRDIGVLAAFEMVRARPLFGVGPGAYENAFIPARLAAEERVGRRLVHLSGAAHFENAHSDPLTLAAECGLPTALLSLGAFVGLLAGLARARGQERAATARPTIPAEELLVLLAAFGVLSLGGFPLRLAVASGPFGFVAGLSLRRLGGTAPAATPRRALRSVLFTALAAFLLAVTGIRFAAGWLQARGESELRGAGLLEGTGRAEMNDSARRRLRSALDLRSKCATAWIALGSTWRLDRDWERAFLAYARSLSIEERAETDFNLGLVAAQGSPEGRAKAVEFWRRAIWIFPRLLEALPLDADAEAMKRSLDEAEARLRAGGKPPDLPDGLAPRL